MNTPSSTNIPWSPGMNYGLGVNLLNGAVAGKAVMPGTIKGPTEAEGATTSYDLTLIKDFEDLYRSLDISVDAGGQYGLFSASGKFKYAQESKFNTQATFLLARCVVQNAFTQTEDAQLNPDGSGLITQGKTDLFQQRYGDGFVRGIQAGGEFFAVISITSSSQEDQESVAISLQAKYGGLFASGYVNSGIDTNTKTKIAKSELRISTYQKGGKGADGSLAIDIEEVIARLKAFPEQVNENPVPYSVQVASYNTLPLPQGPNFIDIQAQKDALIDYARIQLKLLALRNDIEFLEDHPEFFIDPPASAIVTQWQEFVTDQLNQLTRQASKCANNPVGGCDLFPFKLPDSFLMPKRKILNSNPVVIFDSEGFKGNSQLLQVGRYDSFDHTIIIGNDIVHSVTVAQGFVARMYEHSYFQGHFIDLREDTAIMGTFWSAAISSIIVYKETDGPLVNESAVIFKGINWDNSDRGGIQFLQKGLYDGITKPLQFNVAGSALIPEGMVLRLYSAPGFLGNPFIDIRGDTLNIPAQWILPTGSLILYKESEQVDELLSDSTLIVAIAEDWPDKLPMRKIDPPSSDFTISTKLETIFPDKVVPAGYYGVGLVLASITTQRGVFFLKGVGDTGQSISCYAFELSDTITPTNPVGPQVVFYSDNEVYLRMSKKGDQLLDLSYSNNGEDWNAFAKHVDLTSIGFTAGDSYEVLLTGYTTTDKSVSGRFFETSLMSI
ncbi:MAG: hypothetical protein JWR38_503 [Mucilaginibacter sp.]|nr:hypothetical protein [Mucilaginibacter sp.]